MKLYYSRGACSLAVRIVIHEIGLQCDFESVDLDNISCYFENLKTRPSIQKSLTEENIK